MLPARVFKTEGLGENTKPAASGAAQGRAALLPLTGEEALEVGGACFVLSDDLTLLPALANLNSWYFSVKSCSAGFPSIPCCSKELGTV